MGLFDRLRGNDDSEEVELRPQSDFDRTRRQVNNPRSSRQTAANEQQDEVDLEEMWDSQRQAGGSGETAQRDRRGGSGNRRDSRNTTRTEDTGDAEDSDDFILPGMNSAADEPEEETAGATGTTGTVDPSDERLDQLLEQNERIIALLEEIADMSAGEDDDDTGSPMSESGMW
jgi:hypothetical protein